VRISGVLVLFGLFGAWAACHAADDLSGVLTVFHAGSLSVPMKEIAAAFKREHPRVEFRLEAVGSVACARKLTELGRTCDVLASADYLVIDRLLIPDHAAWNLKFATNEMCIVYKEGARRSQEITRENWFQILLDPQVSFGRADPNQDPCGYRAILTTKLAEMHYRQPGLADKVLAKDLRFIRPKETDLLGLVESGSLDYIFLYRSVAQQHALRYLILPDEVNLKNPEYADLYGSVSVELSGKNPGATIAQKGEAMVYAVTIPKKAENPNAALAFVQFMLQKEKGMAAIERLGQPSAVPSVCTQYDALPAELRGYARLPQALPGKPAVAPEQGSKP
jgi:molybdate/tungstate transport system substrate-binding protein